LQYLEEVGDPATGEPIGGTDDNLKAAIAGETHEYTDMYPGMARAARDEGFEEIADWFETLAKAEKSHAGRFPWIPWAADRLHSGSPDQFEERDEARADGDHPKARVRSTSGREVAWAGRGRSCAKEVSRPRRGTRSSGTIPISSMRRRSTLSCGASSIFVTVAGAASIFATPSPGCST
jgi:hypothetical protein